MLNRRDFLKNTAASAAYAALSKKGGIASSVRADLPAPKPEIEMFVTDAQRRHQRGSPLRWAQSQTASITAIEMDPTQRFQPILGFGGALTDATCYLISQLPEASRKALLNELFSPSELGFSVCRICIGSSDYSRDVFSYDEGEPDPQLARFSVDHDAAI